MIIVTGDITSEKEKMTAFKSFGTFMESFKLPWAFVFGNHEGIDIKYESGEKPDGIKIADRKQLSDYLESLEYCIYEAGDGSFTTQSVIRHRGQSTVTIGKEK